MGFRFHKSVGNKYFRVNYSKSGVGYSVGIPGYRYSKMPNGRERITMSIPGTGVSYIEESSSNKSDYDLKRAIENEDYHELNNGSVEGMKPTKYKEFIDDCQEYLDTLLVSKIAVIGGIAMFVLATLCMMLNIAINKYVIFVALMGLVFVACGLIDRIRLAKDKIKLDYSFESVDNPYINLKSAMSYLSSSNGLFYATSVINNARSRVHAGASTLYSRKKITIETKSPVFIETNIKCYYIKLPKEELFILPDKMLVVSKNKIGAVDLTSIMVSCKETEYCENEKVPSDAMIIGESWNYVNNDGSRDKRFINNWKIPICKYMQIELRSYNGINILLFASNCSTAKKFSEIWNSKIRHIRVVKKKHTPKENPVYDDTVNRCMALISNCLIGERFHYGDENTRYLLGVKGKYPLICFGINPSRASLIEDDPTIKKIKKVAEENHCDSWIMLNLYPQRTSDPNNLHHVDEYDKNIIRINQSVIKMIFELYPGAITIASWGDSIEIRSYLKDCLICIYKMAKERRWYIRGSLTKKGNPRHQLYVADNTPLQRISITDCGDILLL